MTGAHAGVVHDLVVHGHEVRTSRGGPGMAETRSVARRRAPRGLLGWTATALVAAAAFVLVSWAGIAFNVVSTSSMVPTYKPTDMLLTLGPNVKTPGIGDAVVFETDYVGQHIPPHVHRIVARNDDGTWTTKGDANPQPDGWRVQPAAVKGVVVASMPSTVLRNPVLIGLMLFGVLAIGLWPRKKDPKDPEDPGSDDTEPTAGAAAAYPHHASGRPHHAGSPPTDQGDASVHPPPRSHRRPAGGAHRSPTKVGAHH